MRSSAAAAPSWRLSELANVARRKLRMSRQDTHGFLSLWRGLLNVHPLAVETHETGLALAERYNLAIHDAMIAASALDADCDTLWSEDMQQEMVLERRLRIIDPFREGDNRGTQGELERRHNPSLERHYWRHVHHERQFELIGRQATRV